MGRYSIVNVACGDMGSIGRAASMVTAMDATTDCGSKAVVMIGIAFGANKKKQNIGDALVSEIVIMYEANRASGFGQK